MTVPILRRSAGLYGHAAYRLSRADWSQTQLRLKRNVLSSAAAFRAAIPNMDIGKIFEDQSGPGWFTFREKLEIMSEDLIELLSSGSFDAMDPENVYADVKRIPAKLEEAAAATKAAEREKSDI